MLRERAPIVIELIVAACGTALVVAATRPAAPHPWRCATAIDLPAVPSFERDMRPAAVPDVVDVEAHAIPAADRLYRARRFDEAANVALAAGQLDPEVESLAELYAQAAHAWAVAVRAEWQATIPERVRVAPLFEQLRELRKLDTVLGAPFTAELDAKLAAIARQAAAEYRARRHQADAAIADATADALGVASR